MSISSQLRPDGGKVQMKQQEFSFLELNPLMAGWGGGWMPPPPTGFSSFSGEWEELLLETKFLAVASSLGHLSMKKFSHWTYCLGTKIR